MEDGQIIALYWNRDQSAIQETAGKYGRLLERIAWNILRSRGDAEECVNDTYWNAWNSMPEHWPERLAAFLGKITRNLSFNRYKRERTGKRGGGETALVLDELADCVSDADNVERAIDRQELAKAINSFVKSLPGKKRRLFVRRYWYADSISAIAHDNGMLQGTVSKTLERTRKQLKAYLTERGFDL